MLRDDDKAPARTAEERRIFHAHSFAMDLEDGPGGFTGPEDYAHYFVREFYLRYGLRIKYGMEERQRLNDLREGRRPMSSFQPEGRGYFYARHDGVLYTPSGKIDFNNSQGQILPEGKVLECLMVYSPATVHPELLGRVLGRPVNESPQKRYKAVSRVVSDLRRALNDDPKNPDYVYTALHRGYFWYPRQAG